MYTIVPLLLVVASACASRPRDKGVPLSTPPPGQLKERRTPLYAIERPAECDATFAYPEVELSELTQVKGSPSDLDEVPRGPALPKAFRGTVLDRFHPATVYRSLSAILCVGTDGRIACAQITRSSGDSWFERRVLHAIAAWEFDPYVKDSTPTPVCAYIDVGDAKRGDRPTGP